MTDSAPSRDSFWRTSVAVPNRPGTAPPSSVDVAVIGGGVTGLSAALTLARAGRQVAVLEAEAENHGATSRNFGALGETLKPSFLSLCRKLGRERATAIYREARAAFDHILDFIAAEEIDCDLVRSGRLICAGDGAQLAAIAREQEAKASAVGNAFRMVEQAEIGAEIGTGAYVGGCVIERHATLHPGRFHLALVERCRKAGVLLLPQTPVRAIANAASGFRLRLDGGELASRELILATNGYTGAATPWLRRRLVPIDGFLVLTRPLDPALLARLLPTGRFFHESTFNPLSGRLAPDGRLIFGGFTGSNPRRLDAVAGDIAARIGTVFPELAGVGFDNIWTGRCAAGFDFLPFVGRHEGTVFAGGYCFGSGLPLGLWLGRKAALKVIGAHDAASAFDDDAPGTRFYYRGVPWFAPMLRLVGGLR